MRGVQGREGLRFNPNQHLSQLNTLFFGQSNPLLSNRQGPPCNNNQVQKHYFQSQQQPNNNDQAILHHVSQNHFEKDPESITQLQHLINPEQGQIPREKFNHIDSLNKSVKQIMRSNQQYRGKLLSACQLKAQLQIQNAILLKEKQNLHRENEDLRMDLQEKQENIKNINRYVQKLKQYHSKVNHALKTENIRLQSKVELLQQSKYILQNLSNQNKLLHQKDAKYQLKISEMESSHKALQKSNNEVTADLQIMKRNYEGLHRQMLDMHEYKIKVEEQISKYKGKSAEDDRKIQNQSQKIRQLLQSCEKLHRIQQQQRHKRQIAQNLVFQASRQKQRLETTLQQLRTQLSFKNQAIQYSHHDIGRLSQVKAQLQSIQAINLSLNSELKQLQKKMMICQEGHSHLLHDLHQLESRNAALKLELFVQRDSSSHQLSDNVNQYQTRLAQLKEAFNNQIRKSNLQIQRLNEQKIRLQIVITKKEQFLKQKEKIIAHHIQEIINTQGKLNESELKKAQIEVILKKYCSDYQSLKQSTSHEIVQLKQSIRNLESIIESSNSLSQSNSIKIRALNDENRQLKQRVLAFQNSDRCLKEQINNITSLNGLLSFTIDSLSEQLKVKSLKMEELSNINKQQAHELQSLQTIILQRAQSMQRSQQKGDQLIAYIKDMHAKIKQIQARLCLTQDEKNELERLNQEYCYYMSEQRLQNQRNMQYIDKLVKQNQLTVSKLTAELNYYKKEHHTFKLSTGAIKQIKKQLAILQNISLFLLNDPKISINRFSAYVNSIHKQAFSRQVDKQKSYVMSVLQCSKQMKMAVQKLYLSINLLNEQLQYTFCRKDNEK